MLIGETPNDGLVAESSADLSRRFRGAHFKDYGGWQGTNHSYLTRCQSAAEILIEWLEAKAFSAVPVRRSD